MALYSNSELKVNHKGFLAAKKICAKMRKPQVRKRAFKALLCLDALADYLVEQGFEIDISKNLHKILPMNEEFEFTDIHHNGRFIDVLPVVSQKYVLIPKIHYTYGIIPDLYVVADYDRNTKKVIILGCIEPENIDKSRQNEDYFISDTSQLVEPNVLEEMLSSVKPVTVTDKNHEIFQSYFIDYIDGILNSDNKKRLITHLIECPSCRNTLVEFFDYESIAKNTVRFPDILNDETLDIVGAAAVNKDKYKNFEEITLEIDKEPDEYEEDENKNINPAIDDSLKILYGKGKNRQIFDILNNQSKNVQKSVLGEVIKDISDLSTEQSSRVQGPVKIDSVKTTGSINPKYYEEDLSEGFDISEKSEENKKEEIEDTIEIKENKETVEPEEIAEPPKPNHLPHYSKSGKPVFLEDITPVYDDEIDVPKFKEDLKQNDKNTMSVQDEMILLNETTENDKPDYLQQTKTQINNEPKDKNIYDDLIFVDEEEEFPELTKEETKNELPTAMDSIVYVEEEEEIQENSEDLIFTSDEREQTENDKDESVEEEIIYQNDNINIPVSLLGLEQLDESADDQPLENTEQVTEESLIHLNAEDVDLIDEEQADADITIVDESKDDSVDEVLFDEDNEDANVKPVNEDNLSITGKSETDYDDDMIILDEEDENAHVIKDEPQIISEDDLTIIDESQNDSEDILLFDEDVQIEDKREEKIPENISSAGLAGSSLLDYEETPSSKIQETNFENILDIDDTDIIDSTQINDFDGLKVTETKTDDAKDEDILVIDDVDNNNLILGFAKDDDSDDKEADILDDIPEVKSKAEDEENKFPYKEDDDNPLISNDDMFNQMSDFKLENTMDDLLQETEEQEQTDDDLVILDDEDTVIIDEKPQVSSEDDLAIADEPQVDSDDMLILDDDEASSEDDLAIADEPQVDLDDMLILDDEEASSEDDLAIADEPQVDTDDMLILDDEEASSEDDLAIADEPQVDSDDMLILDDDNEDSLVLDEEDESQNDMLILDEQESDTEEDVLNTLDEENNLLLSEEDVSANVVNTSNFITDEPALLTDDTIQNEALEDDLLYYDGDDISAVVEQVPEVQPAVNDSLQEYDLDFIDELPESTPPKQEKQHEYGVDTASQNEEEDDELVMLDDDVEYETSFTRPASLRNVEPQEEFVRPAGAVSNGDDIPVVYDEDDVIILDEEEQIQEPVHNENLSFNNAEDENMLIPDDEEESANINDDMSSNAEIAQQEATTPQQEQYAKIREQYDKLQEQFAQQNEKYAQQQEEHYSGEVRYDEDGFEIPPENDELMQEQYNNVDYQTDEQAFDNYDETQPDIPADEPLMAADEDIQEDVQEEEDEEEYEDDEEENVSKKKKIIIIAASVVLAVVLISGIGLGVKSLSGNKQQTAAVEQPVIAENNDIMGGDEEEGLGLAVPDENTGEATEGADTGENSEAAENNAENEEAGGLAVPEEEGGLSVPQQQTPSMPPKAGTENATTEDMNKAVANAFSDNPSSVSVRKVSWGVNAALAGDISVKQYLQTTGKAIQAALQKNIASLKGVTPANKPKIQIKVGEDGQFKDFVILKSSGVQQIDEIVLQSVKDTVCSMQPPTFSENTLKANEEASGSKIIKMSITVTF